MKVSEILNAKQPELDKKKKNKIHIPVLSTLISSGIGTAAGIVAAKYLPVSDKFIKQDLKESYKIARDESIKKGMTKEQITAEAKRIAKNFRDNLKDYTEKLIKNRKNTRIFKFAAIGTAIGAGIALILGSDRNKQNPKSQELKS